MSNYFKLTILLKMLDIIAILFIIKYNIVQSLSILTLESWNVLNNQV